MILVNVEDQGPFIQVMIRDNGKGIGKEELPFIFERFYGQTVPEIHEPAAAA